MAKRPSFQFYPADWRKDPELRTCSLEARGLWIDMLCVMHEADPYGHLVVNGRPLTDEQLARIVGENARKVRPILRELEHAGVYETTTEGIVFSRRMVRDEQVRSARAAGGYKSQDHPDVPRKKDRSKDTGKDTLPPSSGASFGGSPSSSTSASAESGSVEPRTAGKKRRRNPEVDRPTDWQPNPKHRQIAVERQVDVALEADKFCDHHDSKGHRFVCWDKAFNKWLRGARPEPNGNGKPSGERIRYLKPGEPFL